MSTKRTIDAITILGARNIFFIFSETMYHLKSLIISLLTVVSKVHFMATAIADFVRMGCVQLQAQIGNKFTSQWPATF